MLFLRVDIWHLCVNMRSIYVVCSQVREHNNYSECGMPADILTNLFITF
jgi:membrane associated rhomboid family serine protease